MRVERPPRVWQPAATTQPTNMYTAYCMYTAYSRRGPALGPACEPSVASLPVVRCEPRRLVSVVAVGGAGAAPTGGIPENVRARGTFHVSARLDSSESEPLLPLSMKQA